MAYTDIDKPDLYFNTVLWTGNGTTLSVTGVNFQPDLVYLKSRDLGTQEPVMYDFIRGVYQRLFTNSTSAESTKTTGLTSFDTDGFSLGNAGQNNGSGNIYVGWNWLASNTTASNTDGSITSTVSANTTSGFSIVKYTGTGANATVGHGLGTSDIGAIIVKNRDSGTDNWWVFHKSIGATGGLKLNGTDATITASTLWNDTAPTSNVFSIGTGSGLNASGQNLIAYVFAEKKGFSKAFSYTGNGSSDGSYIHLGMKPAFVIIKCSSNAGDQWYMYDNKRTTYNTMQKYLYPSSSSAELDSSARAIDFLSNGIKFRNSDTSLNASGYTYIGLAFAENPFVTSTGVPTCAR